MDKKYTLFELNEFIRRVVALNFPDAVWVSAEIAQVNISKGHVFISLVQKEEDGESVVAQSEAVIWSSDYLRLLRKLGKDFGSLLQEGMEVMVSAKVEFNERYGFKLRISDIDPAYTIGKLALQRSRVIETLKKENLLEKNASLPLPPVVQRIAVLSSEKAAGLQDFLDQVRHNQFGYVFKNKLFPTAMQGDKVEQEMIAQLKRIALQRDDFDCVVIIRGGGARLDLVAFDSLKLSRAIASFPLPVIAGIGHNIDETVIDLVAHTSLKTPTAVAEFFIQRNLNFEMQIADLGNRIRQLSSQQLTNAGMNLNRLGDQFVFSTNAILHRQAGMLEFIEEKIPASLKSTLKTEAIKLANLEKMCLLLSPEITLKRGFSLSLIKGKTITSVSQAKAGDTLETRFADGKITSKILPNG